MDPLRSEADAFRVLLIVAAGAATVIVLTLLTNSLVGFIWGLLLVGVAAGRIIRGRRTETPSERVGVLIDEVARPGLIAELAEAHPGAQFEVAMVVAPDASPAEGEMARQRMEISVQRLEEAGLRARGEVLKANPEELCGGGRVPGVDADTVIVSLRGGANAGT